MILVDRYRFLLQLIKLDTLSDDVGDKIQSYVQNSIKGACARVSFCLSYLVWLYCISHFFYRSIISSKYILKFDILILLGCTFCIREISW